MPDLLRMPEIAAGTDRATLLEWPVPAGQSFAAPDVIAIVETDKAVVDVEAEHAGVIVRTLVAPGTEVQVGEPIALVAADGEAVADVDAALRALGIGSAPTPAPARTSNETRIFSSPLARKIAREAGLTLEEIRGSGPHGRILRRDVERTIAERTVEPPVPPVPVPAAPPPPVIAPADATVMPHSKLRRLIATRLAESKRTIPHFYLKAAIEVDALLELRAQLNAASDVKISVNDFVIKAMAAAHRAVPDANVIWTEDALHRFDHADIAVAVAAPNGLVTPVLRHVDEMSISTVSRTVRAVVERARDGRLQQSELVGGSTTVSNLGMFGVDEFSAIINPPHSSILAVGAVAKRPVVLESGELAARSTMNVVLSVDHRAVDGALAAQWMQAFAAAVRAPLSIII